MSKIRKAVTAFAMAAAGAVVAGVVQDGMPGDSAGWFKLLGAAVGVGLAAAYAVWRIPNAEDEAVAYLRGQQAKRP